MLLSELYSSDPQKVLDGVEISLGEAFFTLTYFESDKAKIFMGTKIAIYQKMGILKEDAAVIAVKELLINVIVLGWRNVIEKDNEGKKTEIPYSRKNCEILLERYPGLATDLMGFAGDINLFKREEIEKSKKKSKRPLTSGTK